MAKMILVEKCDGACGYVYISSEFDGPGSGEPYCNHPKLPGVHDPWVDPDTLRPDCPLEDAVEPKGIIIAQIYKALEGLGASLELLAIVGSYGDTLSDEEVLEMLEQYNSNGTIIDKAILNVSDTPETRRDRLTVVGR